MERLYVNERCSSDVVLRVKGEDYHISLASDRDLGRLESVEAEIKKHKSQCECDFAVHRNDLRRIEDQLKKVKFVCGGFALFIIVDIILNMF